MSGASDPTNTSPNMNISVPIPSLTPGPAWAQNVYTALFNTVDAHNHSPGNGVQIQPNGLNISSNLTMNGNSLTNIGSANLSNGLTNNVLYSIYCTGGELWFNDTAGAVQITAAGSVNATTSGISSGTNNASFSGSTLVVTSNTNTPGAISSGPISIGQVTASPNLITIESPNSLASAYTLTLPAALPAATSVLSIDTSGNISALAATTVLTSIKIGTSGPTLSAGGGASLNILGTGGLTLNNSGATSIIPNASTSNIQFPSAGEGLELTGDGISFPFIFANGATPNTLSVAHTGGTGLLLPLVVSAKLTGTEGLVIIRGSISNTGTITNGEGFTVASFSAGACTIDFSSSIFGVAPVITTSINGLGLSGAVFTALVETVLAGSATIITFSGTSATNIAFNFIAIGQRNPSV